MDHLHDLVLHVGGPVDSVHFSDQRRGAYEHVAHAHFTSAVALAVITREALHQHAAEVDFTVQKNPLSGHEHVVEDGHDLLAAVDVARVQTRLFHFSGVRRLAAVDVLDPWGVCRDREAYGVRFLPLAHGERGHYAHLVGVEHAGLVELCAPDDHSVGFAFYHAQVKVRVGLLPGPFSPVPLGIGHGAVHHVIVGLDLCPVFLEPFVITGSVLFVTLEGGGKDGVGKIHAHTALETGAGDAAAMALHPYFIHQVFRAAVQVSEPAYGFTGQ